MKFLRKPDGKINWLRFVLILVVAFAVREAVYFAFHV